VFPRADLFFNEKNRAEVRPGNPDPLYRQVAGNIKKRKNTGYSRWKGNFPQLFSVFIAPVHYPEHIGKTHTFTADPDIEQRQPYFPR
jgi:hypothetical protein